MNQRASGGFVLRWAWAGIAGMVVAGSALTTLARAQSGDPPGVADMANAQVVADGPFGRVPGLWLAPGAGLPDPGPLEALDAYGRGARVELRPAVGSLGAWRVTAYPEPALTVTPGTTFASGSDTAVAELRLPSTGLFLVRLDATVIDPLQTGSPGSDGSWVWRIAVPDRDIPGEGEPYPPAPAIVLASGDRSVELDAGSGCFVGTCGDIGATSPPQTLPTLRTLAGAPLTVRLSDHSGIASWVVDATPVGGASEQTVVLATGTGDPPAMTITLAAPAAGRWVIMVHVRFDRERGSFDGYGRLVLGSTETPGAGVRKAREG